MAAATAILMSPAPAAHTVQKAQKTSKPPRQRQKRIALTAEEVSRLIAAAKEFGARD